ncbi:MAG TPA: hypothetical protein VEU74_13080 [Gemmatimonadales bacterium]|nr:hypothetical protein [Gemmatimonadales bacterium]
MRSIGLASTALLALAVCATARAQQQTGNPHGKLVEECAVCHSPEAWTPALISPQFDHGKHGLVLAGAHAQAACRSCHASLDFHGAARDCVSCHKDIHHGELGSDCARCHTARNFLDRTLMVRAHQLTRFPLSGAHLALDCETCHTPMAQGNLTFVNLRTQCVECHLPQFQTAKAPDHIAGGFSSACSECHAPTIWTAARFNHSSTGFPLTGGHSGLACALCHGDGVYAGKSTACVSCHLQAYNTTNNPNHAGAGFSTACETCHTTAPGWAPANYNHTFFVLPHHTAQCYDCHATATNYATFVCTVCHTQAQTDPHHTGVSGYVWNSTNCYQCHRGR